MNYICAICLITTVIISLIFVYLTMTPPANRKQTDMVNYKKLWELQKEWDNCPACQKGELCPAHSSIGARAGKSIPTGRDQEEIK